MPRRGVAFLSGAQRIRFSESVAGLQAAARFLRMLFFSRIAGSVGQSSLRAFPAEINQRRRGPSWRCYIRPFARRH